MWNYRLVDMEEEEPCIEIREVFYDENLVPYGHSTATISGETIDSINWIIEKMRESFNKPILYSIDFKGNPYLNERIDDE